MLWERGRRSSNIEDRRGARGGGPGGFRLPGGLGGGLGRGGGRGGPAGKLGGLGLVAVVLIALFLGVDPSLLLDGGPGVPSEPQRQAAPPATASAEEQRLRDFVAVVLADTEDAWERQFAERGAIYEQPRLVLFRDAVQSACGSASAAVGPFYCPADRRIYLDLGFFEELDRRFGAPGDFAQAYVIAHEVGHHIQTLLGISQQVSEFRQQAGQVEANRASVLLELQADCLAGVWAHRVARSQGPVRLEPGDLEEGLGAAAAVGDDRLQRAARGTVNPDSFTHGSSAQRVHWFKTGLAQGRLEACDTFAAGAL
jgi:hypothetical protein